MTRPYMLGPVGKARHETAKARAEIFFKQYMSGQCLQDIGTENNMTRERVRQIITKFHGRVAKIGGATLKANGRRRERAAKKEVYSLERFGCSYAQYREIVKISRDTQMHGIPYNQTLCGAYHSQHMNANARGIEWQFTLWTWVDYWRKSGKWAERGRGKNKFVMCRFNDAGPYSSTNVYISTLAENSSAGQMKRLHRAHPMQVAA